MAFNDINKFSDALRLKHGGAFSLPGDPDAIRGVCVSPWCNRWVEDMRKDRRCHEPECDERLWEEALKRKQAVRSKGTVVCFPGAIEDLLLTPEEQERLWENPPDVMHEIEYCIKCAKEPKKPNAEYCTTCWGFVRREKAKQKHKCLGCSEMANPGHPYCSVCYGRKRKKQAKSKTRQQLSNKIKGLDGLIS